MDLTKEQLIEKRALLEQRKALIEKRGSSRTPEPLINIKSREEIGGDIGLSEGNLSPMQRAQTLGIAGVPAAAAGIYPEDAMSGVKDALPIMGQAVGSAIGGFPGSIAGTAIGSAAKEGLNSLAGNEFKLGTVAGDTITTAIVEGLFRGTGKVAYGRLEKIAKLQAGKGAKLDKMKNTLREISSKSDDFKIDAAPLVADMQGGLERIVDTVGTQGAVIRRFLNKFKSKNKISADELMQLKGRLGDTTTFDFKTGKLNGDVNELAKAIGAKTKNMLEELAEKATKAGYKELSDFAKVNKSVSSTLRNLGAKGADSLGGVAMAGTGGTIAGIMTQNPMIGTLLGGALIEMRNPLVKQALYNALGQSGVGKAVTMAASYAARKAKDEVL